MPMTLCEINTTVKPLFPATENRIMHYGDFLTMAFAQTFPVIVANPPFNRALAFVDKCYQVLADKGEMMFILPSKFIKMSSCAKLIAKMASEGSFTHFVFPHDEKLFKDAAIDIVVFRYEKGLQSSKAIMNGKEVFCNTNKGIITFHDEDITKATKFADVFHVFVGSVSGRDEVFKQEFGNLKFLTEEGRYENFVHVDEFPSGDSVIDEHLLANKASLMTRGGFRVTEDNWFKWTRMPFSRTY